MITRLQKPFSTLLASVLALTFLSASAAPADPAASNQLQAAPQTMPDGLLRAFLFASSQPFEAGAQDYRAHSGGLDITLGRSGLRASGPDLAWSLALTGMGRGGQIAGVPGATIAQTESRLEYRRGVLTEWYRDTALGVEQGFTLHRPLPGAGPLVLRLALTTRLAGALDGDARGLSFTVADGQSLRYDHLRAWDADEAALEATLRYDYDQVTILVDDRGAAYPITIDPLIYLEQQVIGEYGAAGDQFGYSVALSEDGKTALVGAIYAGVGASEEQGSAYVFTRSEVAWDLQQRLTASDGAAGDWFGGSVALAGGTALVGAEQDDVGANSDQGSAYVFLRSGATWSEQARLTAVDGAEFDSFGASVALAEDGNTALVGAWYDEVGANDNQGSAYVFTRSGTTWTQQAQLTAADGAAPDNFGSSVALSGDTALVGAWLDDVGGNTDQGSAYVFTRSGTAWGLQQQLTGADGAGSDNFGFSVALSGDTALVGAYRDDVGANGDQGSAYVFVRSGTTWNLQQQLTAVDSAAGDFFGFSVALAGDMALVGARRVDFGGHDNQGAAYVFTRSGETWSEEARLAYSAGSGGDNLGYSVALAGDGNTALAGAPLAQVDQNSLQGSATVFARSDTTWSEQANLSIVGGAPEDAFGVSVAIAGDLALVGASRDDVGGTADQGSAYVFARSGTVWHLLQLLTASDGAAGDQFGCLVALSGNMALVGAYLDDVDSNTDQGSAYVFTRVGTVWIQQARLAALGGAAEDHFGRSVALAGGTALVGAPDDDVNANADQGSAYVFTHGLSGWTQEAQLTAFGAAADHFGSAVALSGDTALVGAPDHDFRPNTDQGSAYVFTRSGTTWTQQAQLAASDAAAGDEFGISVALAGDTALVGSWLDDVGGSTDQGSAYVFARALADWAQQAQLTASDGAAGDSFGTSVAFSGDGGRALVGSWLDDVGGGTDQGSAYLFARSGEAWSEQAHLTSPWCTSHGAYGRSVALSGDGNTALVGAYLDDVGENQDQGTAYFYRLLFSLYLPLVVRNAP